ncbi:uncharacterized protein [Watersipora subatra]|uniref:uncharacterized protein isoform X2 n=1 Tax=Watersipora subatra TaxID=2589382 RepID=UPI00355B9B11
MQSPAQPFSNLKISSFAVQLSPGHLGENIYFAGDRLTAGIIIDVKFPVKTPRVTFKWVQIAKLGNETKRTEGKEVLLGRERTNKCQTLDVRRHAYDVSLELPGDLLPSFECKPHFVRHYCLAEIAHGFRGRSKWCTGKTDFLLYQNSPDPTALIPQAEEKQILLKPLRISYRLLRTNFNCGDTVTIDGEIYNAGKSTVKLKVGVDICQKTKVNGEINLLVTKLRQVSKKKHEGFGYWSKELKIQSACEESFTASLNLRSLPPTTHCLNVDITYDILLKVSMGRSVAFLKPMRKEFPEEILISRGENPRPAMRRAPSGVSIGKSSKRTASTPRATVQQVFSQGDSPVSKYQVRSPPPAYKDC